MHSVVSHHDEAFVEAFHTGQIANQQFITPMTCARRVSIHRHGFERSTKDISSAIRHFAAHHGAADK
jgi:hypothetical protein